VVEIPIMKFDERQILEELHLMYLRKNEEERKFFGVEKTSVKVPSWFKEFLYLTEFNKPFRKTKWYKVAIKHYTDSELQALFVIKVTQWELWKYFIKLQQKAWKMNISIWELLELKKKKVEELLTPVKRKSRKKKKKMITDKDVVEEYESRIEFTKEELEFAQLILKIMERLGKYKPIGVNNNELQ